MLSVLTLLLAAPGPAHAVVQEEVFLPLGIVESGHANEHLLSQVKEALRITGATVAPDRGLRPSDRRCNENGCLLLLAKQYKASVLIAGAVEKAEATTRYVRLWLFDARTMQSCDERAVGEDGELEKLIQEMAIKLVERYRSPPKEAPAPSESALPPPVAATVLTASMPSAATPVAVSKPAATAPADEKKARRARRKAMAATFGVLAAGSLAAAIALTVVNPISVHRGGCEYRFENNDCTVILDMRPAYIGGYAASVALTVAAILSLTLH